MKWANISLSKGTTLQEEIIQNILDYESNLPEEVINLCNDYAKLWKAYLVIEEHSLHDAALVLLDLLDEMFHDIFTALDRMSAEGFLFTVKGDGDSNYGFWSKY